MDFHGKIGRLPQNRVWRTYLGGRRLDDLAGIADPEDSHFPEDWIASLTPARNASPQRAGEGLSGVLIGGKSYELAGLFSEDPAYFLGDEHMAKFGAQPMLLVKLIDSAIRLHFQVHPSTVTARRFRLGSTGKTEAYHILDIRAEQKAPYLYVGFQRPPPREQLREMVLMQDMTRLTACFDRIPVHRGETFLVPAGTPHALGEGLLLLELQEPSDLVVRLEFERAGYTIPAVHRFLGQTLDFCLDLIDLTSRSVEETISHFRCIGTKLRTFSEKSHQELIIGAAQTDCFRMTKLHLADAVTLRGLGFMVGVVTAGSGRIWVGGEAQHLNRFDKILLPAGLGDLVCEPDGEMEIIGCHPPV